MMWKELNVLYEDNQLIVCIKPPGIPSQSDKTGDMDMENWIKNYLHQTQKEQKSLALFVIHRLDRPVGGIMVFAKTALAAKHLARQMQDKTMKKKYLAVLSGLDKKINAMQNEPPVLLTDYLSKDQKTNTSKISNISNKNAKIAQLILQVKTVKDDLALAEIELITGRHHQIRVQMEHNLGAIYGDTKYNKVFQQKDGWYPMGLYAYQLSFTHPVTKKSMFFESIPTAEQFSFFE